MDRRQNKRRRDSRGAVGRRSGHALQGRTSGEGAGQASAVHLPRDLSKSAKKGSRGIVQAAPAQEQGSSNGGQSPSAMAGQEEDQRERRHSPSQRRKKRKVVGGLASRSPSNAVETSAAETREEAGDVDTIQAVSLDVLVPAKEDSMAQVASLREENARLQKEIAAKDGALATQRDTISFFYGQCTCTICLELVWRPHVLSPCGHVFCAHCLIAWFSKPTSEEGVIHPSPGFDLREAQRRRTLRRPKVCPHCRVKVAVAPAEVWMVKGLVDRIDTSMRMGQGNDEHLTRGEESFAGLTASALQEAKGGNLPASSAIWKDIFAQDRRDEPMFDEEDRVYRCTFCANEVVNGACTNGQCGMLYNIDSLDGFSDDGLLDEDYSLGSVDDYDDVDEDDFGFIDDGPITVEDSTDEERETHWVQALQQAHPSLPQHEHDERDDHDSSDEGIQEVDVQGRPVGVRRARYVLSDSEEGSDSDTQANTGDAEAVENDSVDDNNSERSFYSEAEDHQTMEDGDEDDFEEPDEGYASSHDFSD